MKIAFELFECISEIDFGWNDNLGFGYNCLLMGLTKSSHSLKKINFQGCYLNEKDFNQINKLTLENFYVLEEVEFGYNKNLGRGCLTILHGLVNSKNSLKKINLVYIEINYIPYIIH